MATTANQQELPELEKDMEILMTRLAAQDTLLNNLRSSAFALANYYFVFQGVILTIVCSGSETSLKKSDRWFLFTLSILAVVPNCAALIKTGMRYIENQGGQNVVLYEIKRLSDEIASRKSPICQAYATSIKRRSRCRGICFLAICMIFFLGFTVLVLVGCWKFIGTQNEDGFNLLYNDKCIRLCNGAKCLNICSEYRLSS